MPQALALGRQASDTSTPAASRRPSTPLTFYHPPPILHHFLIFSDPSGVLTLSLILSSRVSLFLLRPFVVSTKQHEAAAA